MTSSNLNTIINSVLGLKQFLLGGTDGTPVGNTLDRLKTAAFNKDNINLQQGLAYVLDIQYSLSSLQTIYHSFVTPNTSARIHLKFKTYSAGRSNVSMYEAPTVTVYTFAWTPKNRDRTSGVSSGSTVRAVTTQTSVGTFLTSENNYGSGLTITQSELNYSQEFILQANTEYLFSMQNYEATTNLTTLQLQWYEVV